MVAQVLLSLLCGNGNDKVNLHIKRLITQVNSEWDRYSSGVDTTQVPLTCRNDSGLNVLIKMEKEALFKMFLEYISWAVQYNKDI